MIKTGLLTISMAGTSSEVKDGQVMEALTREGEREFFRLKDKYADYIFDGKKYYKIVQWKTPRSSPYRKIWKNITTIAIKSCRNQESEEPMVVSNFLM